MRIGDNVYISKINKTGYVCNVSRIKNDLWLSYDKQDFLYKIKFINGDTIELRKNELTKIDEIDNAYNERI
jgi:hypothetical protein